jgi:hypothetical protein
MRDKRLIADPELCHHQILVPFFMSADVVEWLFSQLALPNQTKKIDLIQQLEVLIAQNKQLISPLTSYVVGLKNNSDLAIQLFVIHFAESAIREKHNTPQMGALLLELFNKDNLEVKTAASLAFLNVFCYLLRYLSSSTDWTEEKKRTWLGFNRFKTLLSSMQSASDSLQAVVFKFIERYILCCSYPPVDDIYACEAVCYVASGLL